MTLYDLETASFVVDLASLVATVLGLGIAVYAIVHQVSALRREQAERAVEERERDIRRRRAQAECLSARLKLEPDPSSIKLTYYPAPRWDRYFAQVEVFNASQLPFYDIEIRSPDIDHPGYAAVSKITMLPGGQSEHRHLSPQSSNEYDGDPVTLYFTDAAGVRWHRTATGDLHEDPGEDGR